MLGTYVEAKANLAEAFRDQLTNSLRKLTREGRVTSCCVCVDVRIQPSPESPKFDALLIAMESAQGDSLAVYASYAIREGQPVFGAQFVAPGQPTVFPASRWVAVPLEEEAQPCPGGRARAGGPTGSALQRSPDRASRSAELSPGG